MEAETVNLFLKIVDTGTLVFLVYAFYSGKVVSMTLLDKVLASMIKTLTEQIGKAVENAVARGIYRGNGKVEKE